MAKDFNYSFSFSGDDGSTWTSVADAVDAAFTTTDQAGGFTGTVVGPFATNAL